MSIIGWLVLGLAAGFIGCKVMNKGEECPVMDIALGISGAIMGGFLFSHFFGVASLAGFNFCSMFVAVVGAVAVLALYHLAPRRPST